MSCVCAFMCAWYFCYLIPELDLPPLTQTPPPPSPQNTTQSNILVNFGQGQPGPAGGVEVNVARICVALCVFSGYAIPNYVGRGSLVSALEWDVDKETGEVVEISTARHVGLTLGYVGLATATAIGATIAKFDLGFVVSIIGATAAVVVQYIFPGLMLMKMNHRWLGRAFIFIGICMSICGLFITIVRYVCKASSSDFCLSLGLGVPSYNNTGPAFKTEL